MAANIERDCCSICLGDYKDPRILPCQHVFCCQCLLDYVAEKKQINCPNCMTEVEIPPEGIEALPKVVDEPLQDSIEPEDCDVCKKGNQAAFQCFECDRSMCDACKKFHDVFSSNHQIYELKTSDSESFCESHPKSFLKFYCKTCKYLICQVCLDEDHHSKHFVLGIEDFFAQKQKQFEDYQQKIDGRLQRISEITDRFISSETKNFHEVMKRIPKLEAELKSYKENARLRTKLNSDEDEKLSQRLTAAIKHLDKPLNKSTNIKDILDLTRNIEFKIEIHQKDSFGSDVYVNMEDVLGTLDVKIGRLFAFRFQDSSIKSHMFFVGGIHWTVEATFVHSDDNKLDTKITLNSFVKEEDKELVESVTADLVFTLTCRDDSVVKKLSMTFNSDYSKTSTSSLLAVYKLKYGFGWGYPSRFDELTIRFDIKEIRYKKE